MNVLYINSADLRGGATRTSWDLLNGLEKAGHQGSLFVKKKYSHKSNVFEIPQHRYESVLSTVFATDMDFFRSDLILQTTEFKKADLVHCHNLHKFYFNLGTLAKMAKLKPVVWTLHDMWAVTPHCAHAFNEKIENGFYRCPSLDVYPRILWHNERYLCWRKKQIYENSRLNLVVPSRWLQEKLTGTILAKQPSHLIPYGIDTTLFDRTSKLIAREKLGLPPKKKIVLFSAKGGKNNPWKGGAYAEAVAKNFTNHKEIMFIFVGGREDQSFQQSNVSYCNFVTKDETMALYYSAADVFLLTSVAENLPYTVLEALSCGLPVVSFDVGGVKEEVVHKRHGYIARYGDSSDLTCGISYIFSLKRKELTKMSNDSRIRAREFFSLDKMTKSHLVLYKRLIG